MDWKDILIQVIGLMGNVAVISAVQFNNRKIVLGAQALACILWSVHYGALGAVTALCTNFISFGRSAVFFFNHKKWAKSKLWVLAYLAFYMISAALTWQNAYSLLPALASCTSTVAFYQKRTEHTKLLQILASLITLTYTILQSHSLTVYFGVTLTIVTASLSLWRSFRERKTSADPQES